MSDVDESAIDAMVDEVMEGREAKEAAKAPKAAKAAAAKAAGDKDADSAEASADLGASPSETETEEVDAPAAKIGFADGAQATAADVEPVSGDEVEALRAERDSFLADSQRLAADFANYRKQSDKRVSDAAATQSAGLVRDLILVLDACDAALVQDTESAVGPIRSQLIGELTKNGLELLAPAAEEIFDPEQHEAVMHEPAAEDSEHDGPVIGEVLRAGYTWKGRVVRPAMVKVVG